MKEDFDYMDLEEKRGNMINNKKLLKDFFNEANRLVNKEGKVILSLSTEDYVKRWKPQEQAVGFTLECKKCLIVKIFKDMSIK